MKIYTKTGDKGQTSLFGGTRVSKNHIRIEAYGTVDELNSWIGLIRDQNIDEEYRITLIEIQDRLFTLGALLAADPEKSKNSKGENKFNLPQIIETDISFLENSIDKMEENLEPLKSFVLPGGHTTVSYCHIARCVCRRAERLSVALDETQNIDEILIKYLNRLSDYLFVLSRKLSSDLKANEQPWRPRL